MILSDGDLKARIAKGEIEVEPLDDPDLQIQPASIDLRLSDRFVVYQIPHVACIDPKDESTIVDHTSASRYPAIWWHEWKGAVALGASLWLCTQLPALLTQALKAKSP